MISFREIITAIISMQKINIKNMVCPRCIKVVREELTKAGAIIGNITLGTAEILNDFDADKLASVLKRNGFELIEEKSAKLVNTIKAFVINLIRSGSLEDQKLKISTLLEQELSKDYNYLSQLFSQTENTTLEKYIIAQKTEQVKEWLVYDELTLSEMAYKLGYSSVAHLSTQFKQVTGFTPSAFKQLKYHNRKSLDEV